jgi:pentatricopeptide repeat protein
LEVTAMGYVARVPSNVSELHDSLKKIHENKSHVKSVKVNETTSHIEVDLDWSAHKFGGEAGKDFFIPIKRGKSREAKEMVDKMMRGDHAPDITDAQHLYDLIDPQNK